MKLSCYRLAIAIFMVKFSLFTSVGFSQHTPTTQHELVEKKFTIEDADYEHPVYKTSFETEKVLSDWILEGGWMAHIHNNSLVLDSQPSLSEDEGSSNHLVFWLKKEVPANFLLEFKVRPVNKQRGLNIVFFSARGRNGESIFDATLQQRTGVFKQYTHGDLDNYHVSYFAPNRGFTNLRKNYGFHLVTSGKDYFHNAEPDTFQKVQVYKRDNLIRVLVDDKVAIAFDDDGKTYGPVLTQSGWIGLRQMGFTQRCEYKDLAVFPLKNL